MTKNVHAWNTNPDCGGNVGHCFIAIDISKLGNPQDYKKRADDMIDEIKSSEKAIGVEKIYYPGEIESGKKAKCIETGYVEIFDEVMQSIENVEEKLNLK